MIGADLFSGLGGFTSGATSAGVRIALAANHWPDAVAWHERNHPDVEHLCQDLAQVDMRVLPREGLLVASPACQGFSSNGRPGRVREAGIKHQADRNTSWAVLSACDTARPRRVIVENVPDFLRWELFPAWRGVLEAMGYHVRVNVLNPRDYGGPQDRPRAIIVGSLDGKAPELAPAAAHARTISDVVDLDSAAWMPIDSKRPGILARMRQAQDRNGSTCFWANVDRSRGRRLDEQFPTATTRSIGQWYLLRGDECRMLTVREFARVQSLPEHYELPQGRTLAGRLIGNAIDCRMAEHVVRQVVAA